MKETGPGPRLDEETFVKHGQPPQGTSSDPKALTRVEDCPDEADVARLVSAPEGDPEAAAFLDHASACERCAGLVGAAMGDDEDAVVPGDLKTAGAEWQRQMAWRFAEAQRAPRASSRRWVWGAAATLAVAAAVFVVVRL